MDEYTTTWTKVRLPFFCSCRTHRHTEEKIKDWIRGLTDY